jgi:hypothetical protein
MGLLEALWKFLNNRADDVDENHRDAKLSYDQSLSMNFDWIYHRKNPGEKFYFIEKRRFQRFRDGQHIFCYPMTSFPIKGKVLDASLGGLRLKANEMLQRDTDIGVVLYFKGVATQFLVRVLWEAGEEGDYEYGVEFVKQRNNSREVLQYISHLKG